jgi:hypothetical protein
VIDMAALCCAAMSANRVKEFQIRTTRKASIRVFVFGFLAAVVLSTASQHFMTVSGSDVDTQAGAAKFERDSQ